PVGIAVDDALDRAVHRIADRIGKLMRRLLELARVGEILASDRIGRIARVDQALHMRADRDGKAFGDPPKRGPARLGDEAGLDQPVDRGDRLHDSAHIRSRLAKLLLSWSNMALLPSRWNKVRRTVSISNRISRRLGSRTSLCTQPKAASLAPRVTGSTRCK